MPPSFSISLQARYAETDAMGVVHHRHFLTWLEWARVRWLDVVGLPYRQLEADGYFLPVVEVEVRYKNPAFFDDLLTLHLSVIEPVRARIALHYDVVRRETPVAEATTVHVFLDRNRRLIRPPEIFLEKVRAFQSSA
jgi:acyl-CoA thioester hydrolase